MQNRPQPYGMHLDGSWPGSPEQKRLQDAVSPIFRQNLLKYDSAMDLLHFVHLSLLAALAPSELVITLWNPVQAGWTLLPSPVALMTASFLEASGRLMALEQARDTGEAALYLSTSQRRGIFSVGDEAPKYQLAVPFYWWTKSGADSERILAGCFLCSHRSGSEEDAATVMGVLAQVVQTVEPALNALRLLKHEPTTLLASLAGPLSGGVPDSSIFSIGGMSTREESYHRLVMSPLHRASHARNVTILLRGPTGSGKTWLAEWTHRLGHRRDKPFVVLDCSQITSAETLGAELFGYASESGYFNSPKQGRPGKARLADTGTLFLDEIGCLPPELQQKLLRLIEKGRFSPLGSSAEITVDVQIMAATNVDLETYVAQRLFREDLLWRLNDVVVRVPALSEHPRDIPELAMGFLNGARQRLNRSELEGFSPEALLQLQSFDWEKAGNVRGLQHTVQRSILLSPVGCQRLEEAHLRLPTPTVVQELEGAPGSGRRPAPRVSSPKQEGSPELEAIEAAILRYGYATEAARMLGISHRQLTWQLQRAGTNVREILSRGRG